jgi:hypothetical protein
MDEARTSTPATKAMIGRKVEIDFGRRRTPEAGAGSPEYSHENLRDAGDGAGR